MKTFYHHATIGIALLFSLFVFASCESKEAEVALQMRLDRTIVSGEEGQQFLTVETDPGQAWSTTVDPGGEWCLVEPSSGTGSAYAIVTTFENNGDESRTATITVRAGKTKRTEQLTQQEATLLDVVGSTTRVGNTASQLTFSVRTKSSWQASVTAGGEFCTVSPTSGTGNATLTVNFTAHSGSSARTANLHVSGSGQEVNIVLTQGDDISRPEQNIPQRIELPEVVNARWFVDHDYWAMEYDTAQRHSVWVAYVFNNAYNQKVVSRTNAWAFDPVVPREYQSLNSTSQTYPGFDRGHLCASEDRVFSLAANQQTFYFTNMSPQLGAGFNSGIWARLEEKVRGWAQASDCDTLYVVTGGAINPGVQIGATNSSGVYYERIADRNNVVVPKYYFKALVKRKGDAFEGIAFWLENKSYTSSPTGNNVTHEYSMTIRELEEKTGINFFPNLKLINPLLEESVETRRDVSKWPL